MLIVRRIDFFPAALKIDEFFFFTPRGITSRYDIMIILLQFCPSRLVRNILPTYRYV